MVKEAVRDMSKSDTKDNAIIAFIFDSGRIEDSFYGNTVFKSVFSGKEVMCNPRKIIVSLGDITDYHIFEDITPYLIRNDLCTVKRRQEQYKDNLFVFLLEDIDTNIAKRIDTRLHEEIGAYIGMTSINVASTDARKQFWKSLIRCFSVEYDLITAFGQAEEETFQYYEAASAMGFRVSYDNFPYGIGGYSNTLFSTRQSTIIHSASQLQFVEGKSDSDRGILEMNFSLVKEVEIAGVQIWKAIEDINRVTVTKVDDAYSFIITDYLFTSLYQAAQGMERLLKVMIELYAYDVINEEEREKINDLLYGHNHLAMSDFLLEKDDLKLKPTGKKLLKALTTFYLKARYHRYSYSNDNKLELRILRDFGSDISEENFDDAVKHLYGKAVGQTSHIFYKHIIKLSHKLNIFAYELNSRSVASFALNSYYGDDLYDLLKRIEQSKKELLWYLIQEGSKLPAAKFSDELSALPFEQCDIPEFLNELITDKNSNSMLYDFVSDAYDELVEDDKVKWKERVEAIDALVGNTNVYFEEFDDLYDDIDTDEEPQ